MATDSPSPEESPQGQHHGEPLIGSLNRVVQGLRAQPLLFGLGVLIVLALVASFSLEALSLLRFPAIVIAVVGLVAWVVVRRTAVRRQRPSTRVRIAAEGVGEKGKVTGIEGRPLDPKSDASADIKVKDVAGQVTGIRGQRSGTEDRG